MKISEKNAPKKRKNKDQPVAKPKKEHVLIVAQEIKFARLLAGNEKKTRDRALKTLKKWLFGCFQKGYEFKEDDFARIWKGLFYAVWMSDKPLVQEELCDNIAGVLDLFPPEQYKHALLMTHVGFKTLATEWYGIDQHRMDKCLMMVRRYLRGSLRCVSRGGWSEAACKAYAKMLSGRDGLFALKTPLYARNATSMQQHFIDCFLEEIAKVSNGDISPVSLSHLLRPFCAYMCGGESVSLATACRALLTQLLRQSERHATYMMRTRAWEQMGCPEGGPEALVSDDEDDEQDEEPDGEESDLEENGMESALDPRAGRVDVVLARLPVPSEELAATLRDMLRNTSSKAHRRAKICLQRYEKLSRSEFPLPVERAPSPPAPAPARAPGPRSPAAAAHSLRALEKTLVSSSDELALRGLSRKHRKRLLAKSRAGLSIVEDAAKLTQAATNAAGDWQVEETNTQTNKKDTSNKENVSKNKKRKLETRSTDNNAAKKLKTDAKIVESKETSKNNKNKSADKPKSIKTDSPKSLKIYETQKQANTKEIKKVKNEVSTKTTQAKLENGKQTTNDTTKSVKNSKIKPNSTLNTKPTTNVKITQASNPKVVAKKVKKFQKQLSPNVDKNSSVHTPKKVKFVLKNNSMQGTMDYYKSVRQSPSIPFDSSKQPSKTNLKVSTPSPINPFFKKKLRLRV